MQRMHGDSRRGSRERTRLGLLGGGLALLAMVGLARKSAAERPSGGAREAFRGGLEAFRAGHLEQALAAFEAAAKKDARFVDAHVLRGTTLTSLQRPAAAVEAFSQALALAPERATIHLYRGGALAALGEVARAAADFEQAERLAAGDRRIAVAARFQRDRLRRR